MEISPENVQIFRALRQVLQNQARIEYSGHLLDVEKKSTFDICSKLSDILADYPEVRQQ